MTYQYFICLSWGNVNDSLSTEKNEATTHDWGGMQRKKMLKTLQMCFFEKCKTLGIETSKRMIGKNVNTGLIYVLNVYSLQVVNRKLKLGLGRKFKMDLKLP